MRAIVKSISNNIQSGSLIYKSESITIRNGKYWNMDWKHSKAMSTGRITQECDVGIGTGTEQGPEQC